MAHGPEHGRAKRSCDQAGEHSAGQRPAGREAAQHPRRAKGQSDQCDNADHSLLVNNGDRWDSLARALFAWTHVVIGGEPALPAMLRSEACDMPQ